MIELNAIELDIFKYIEKSIEKDGYAPSVRDICTSLGIKSTSTVHLYLNRLENKGYLKKGQGKSRAISLEKNRYSDSEKMLRVPLLGRVTAGSPILAVQNYDGYVDYPISMCSGKEDLFALRIMGESMIEAGIMDGDIVVVDGCHYAENGDIIVALIDDEATVKKYYKEKDRIRLQPCNATMNPIYSKNVSILGKVIANFRFYKS